MIINMIREVTIVSYSLLPMMLPMLKTFLAFLFWIFFVEGYYF